MFRKCSSIVQKIRQVIGRSLYTSLQLSHSSKRSNYYYHHHRHTRRWDKGVLLALASVAGFSFSKYGVPNNRYEKLQPGEEFEQELESSGWETLVQKKDLKVFRRRVPGPYEMYEYKCVGTYYDISPGLFLDVQNDLIFRSQWDVNVLNLELLDEEDEHELIRWVQKYPYPLYPREYIYARRTWVSEDYRTVIVDSEAVPSHLIAGSSKNVRVVKYRSRMAVRAHDGFHENGLDFALTYFDNPETNMPRLHSWLVNRGGPYFLKQVHEVARGAQQSGRVLSWTSDRVHRIRLKAARMRAKALAPEAVKLEANISEEDEVDESELVDASPLSSKAKKFAFTSVDNIPVEVYVSA